MVDECCDGQKGRYIGRWLLDYSNGALPTVNTVLARDDTLNATLSDIPR